MRRRRTWVIGYDIASPRRLRRVARLLESHAFRVQYSLFVACWTEAEFAQVWRRLEGMIHPRSDDVRAWPLAENAQVLAWGMTWPQDLLVVDSHSRPFGRVLGTTVGSEAENDRQEDTP
jgi:CRISPR-associated protein Cas2